MILFFQKYINNIDTFTNIAHHVPILQMKYLGLFDFISYYLFANVSLLNNKKSQIFLQKKSKFCSAQVTHKSILLRFYACSVDISCCDTAVDTFYDNLVQQKNALQGFAEIKKKSLDEQRYSKYLLCQSENLPLINSSKLGIHLQVLLIQGLKTKTNRVYHNQFQR